MRRSQGKSSAFCNGRRDGKGDLAHQVGRLEEALILRLTPASPTRIYLELPLRYSSRGPRYSARLGRPDGELIVIDTLTPFFDSARALRPRGLTGRLEMWDSERPYPRMSGDIEALAKLT